MKSCIFYCKLLAFICFLCIIISSCQKELSGDYINSLLAEGTLKTPSGGCISHSIVGDYYRNIRLSGDSNYINVGVKFTRPGNYYITTNKLNGFYFVDSGFMPTTGDTIIRLHAIGVPDSVAINNFSIQFGNDVCDAVISVIDSIYSPTKPTTGTWQFTGAGWPYSGIITQGSQTPLTNDSILVKVSGVTANADTMLNISFKIPSSTIQTGFYFGDGVSFSFTDLKNDSVVYIANSSVPYSQFNIDVLSYDAITKQMTATFGGTVQSVFNPIADVWGGTMVVNFP